MNEESPHSSQGSSSKSWWDKISQVFSGEPQNRDELVDVISEAEERDLIDPNTKEMIEGVLEVAEMRVRDIMIPRSQMVTLDIEQSIDSILPTLTQTQHSRYPVVNEDKDHVEGILLVKDLLPYSFQKSEEPQLKNIIRAAVIVPEGKKVDTLLKEFKDKRYHMAIVVDEYGGVSGLVTIEDILEVIVGEIEDETDNTADSNNNIRRLTKNTFNVAALTELVDFNEYFDSNFDVEEADTIGGTVLHAFGHMPTVGEYVEIGSFQFKVINADERRLHQLQVTAPKREESEPVDE